MNNDQLEAMLTARQVAEFLQVSVSTVRRWSDRGMLRFYRIGSRGDRRYVREDVLAFLHESSGLNHGERAVHEGLASSSAKPRSAPLGEPQHGQSRSNRR